MIRYVEESGVEKRREKKGNAFETLLAWKMKESWENGRWKGCRSKTRGGKPLSGITSLMKRLDKWRRVLSIVNPTSLLSSSDELMESQGGGTIKISAEWRKEGRNRDHDSSRRMDDGDAALKLIRAIRAWSKCSEADQVFSSSPFRLGISPPIHRFVHAKLSPSRTRRWVNGKSIRVARAAK